jgi:nucleotide-binding universal stress UspA family protein
MSKNTAIQDQAIVVGVDGSASSQAALKWAAKQGQLTNTPVVAVATWDWPTNYGTMDTWSADIDFEKDARSLLQLSMEESLDPDTRNKILPLVIHGPAGYVLEGASRTASLLVVGCRGHGEFAGMLLGSVSEFLATHSHCPIVIIRGDEASS